MSKTYAFTISGSVTVPDTMTEEQAQFLVENHITTERARVPRTVSVDFGEAELTEISESEILR